MKKFAVLCFLMFILPAFIFAGDPLDEIDGTESWYEGTMDGNGDIVYYNAAYEKDMKEYLAYLKSKQKTKTELISISSKVNRRNKKAKSKDYSDDLGEIGSIKEEQNLGDELSEKKTDDDLGSLDDIEETKPEKKESTKKETPVKSDADDDLLDDKKSKTDDDDLFDDDLD